MLAAVERAKYEQIWQVPEYSKYSPGKENVGRFLDILQPAKGSSLIDIGCGQGVAGIELAKHGLNVWWFDITDTALLPAVDRERFIQMPLWVWPDLGAWRYGFCCDVMEHIPPEYTMLCIEQITLRCKTAWLQICNMPDNFGRVIGQPLHLTVQPFTWWRDRLRDFGTLVEARDLCGNSLFVVER